MLQPGAVPARTNDSGNNIVNVLRDLGQDLNALHSGYRRALSVTPGRDYTGTTKDWGVSGQVDYDLGAATLTSITAYRHYNADQGGDIDYSTVDILYRAPGGAGRRFNTFTQELRLNGHAFGDKLDWLVGAYYANEDLKLTDNLRFGNQYGRFATCRIVSPGGLSRVLQSDRRRLPKPSRPRDTRKPVSVWSGGTLILLAAMDNLDHHQRQGHHARRLQAEQPQLGGVHAQHLPRHAEDRSNASALRYTHENKKLNATFGNDNTACVANQALVGRFADPNSPFLCRANIFALSEAILRLSCQGNSTSELNGVSIHDKRSEGKLTGTGVLSYKPVDNLLLYASYSRGYKAGGFNLDRSALKSPTVIVRQPTAAPRRWSATSSSTRRPSTRSRSAANSRAAESCSTSRVPAAVQEFPAQHVRRIGVHRPEHQRLQLEPERARPRPELQSRVAELHPAGDRGRRRVQHQPRGGHGRLPARTSATASARPVSRSRAPSSRCAI